MFIQTKQNLVWIRSCLRRLKQKVCLSLELLDIWVASLAEENIWRMVGNLTGAGKNSKLKFADGTTLIAAKELEMIQLLRYVEHKISQVELKLHKNKAKIMIVEDTFQLTDRWTGQKIEDSIAWQKAASLKYAQMYQFLNFLISTVFPFRIIFRSHQISFCRFFLLSGRYVHFF